MALNFNNVNFGNTILLGSISGIKFNDLNSNGAFDPGETPLSNVQIFLDLDGNGAPSPNDPVTLTGPQGNYGFFGLPAGNYAVREISPPGFIQTTPNPNLSLAPGQNLVGINFGNVQPVGSIAGTKFNDLNGNGILDPNEPPIAGVSVFLDANNNGVLNQGEPVFVTDAQGTFGFGGLPTGTYVVREVVPPGFQQTTPTPTINLAPGQNVGTLIGNAPLLGSITGVKFNDFNGNGIREAGEPPIQGVQIFLDFDGNGAPTPGEPITVTDAQGNYGFFGLAAGNYAVREVPPAGFIQTTPSPNVNLAPGQNVAGANFGNLLPLGSIAGQKFNDSNGNGIREANEGTIPGVQIYLDLNNDGLLNGGEPVSVTDLNGTYGFGGLAAGTYTVREVVPPGFAQTTGSPTLSLAPGQNLGLDFGNRPLLGSISGIKFNDLNANALLDPNEPPIPGVTIYLDLNNDGVLGQNEPSTVTNAQGAYSFQGLALGTYTVREVQPPGFVQTTANPVVAIDPSTGATNFDFLTGSFS